MTAPFRQGSGFTGCSNYIKSTLIPSVTSMRITNIFDNELTDLAGFPAATITATEQPGKVLDNSRNEHIYRFMIRIFIDRNKQNFGSSKAETILRTLADEITLKIDSDPTLGGNCIVTKVFPAKFGYVNRESNNLRVMEITLDCQDAVTWR
jgi:hypothetical protein